MVLSVQNLDRACAAVIVAVLTACIVMFSRLSIVEKNSRRHTIRMAEKQTGEIARARSALLRLNSAVDAARAGLGNLNERVPAGGQMGAFLAGLDSLIKERNVMLLDLQPQAPAPEGPFLRTPLRMSLAGRFGNIHRVLHDLENSARVARLDTLKISAVPETSSCRVEMEISLFER